MSVLALLDKHERANARRGAAVRRSVTARAMKRIEQGLDARTEKGASVRYAQFAIEEELERKARLADPVEVAKQVLRKRYKPVLSAETIGGPKGKFYVGQRLVSRDELFAMAERVAA